MSSGIDYVNINDDVVSPKYNIGGGDVDSVKEAYIRPSTDDLNNNDNLVSGFDSSTCSGDNVYDIFENEDEVITEDSIILVSTNKTMWEGRVIKNTYSYCPKDSNY